MVTVITHMYEIHIQFSLVMCKVYVQKQIKITNLVRYCFKIRKETIVNHLEPLGKSFRLEQKYSLSFKIFLRKVPL